MLVNPKPGRCIYEFGPFRLNPEEHILFRDNTPVSLRPKEFAVLLALVEVHGHVCTKNDLLERVWPGQYVEEGNLNRQISTLRNVLGDTADQPLYIATIPKVGYRFTASVREIRDENSDLVIERHTIARVVTEEELINDQSELESKQDPHALLTAGEKQANRKRLWTLGIAAVLLVALSLGFAYAWRSRNSPEQNARATPRSLAVLPFKPIGDADDNQYLGLGMADALITKLSNIKELNIRPTSAVRKYDTPEQNPVAAGRELRVDAVVEGSVQRIGERIRVTVQLVSVHDGAPLWAEKFDEQFTNIFSVQDRISEQVARALPLTLSTAEKEMLSKRYTANSEAYQLYLKGRYFSDKRTEEGLQKGLEYFQQAINLDANYALAYAGLADSNLLLAMYGALPPKDSLPKAKAMATKALEKDSGLVEAHISLAFARMTNDLDWSGAEVEFKRAIELNPNHATARHWYAEYLAAVRRHDEAIIEIKRAQELDPVSLIIHTEVGRHFYYARQHDRAIDELRKAIEMDPNFARAHQYLGRAYEQKGMYEEAVVECQKAWQLDNTPRTLSFLGYANARLGKRAAAQKILDELKGVSKRKYVSPYWIAVVYTGLDDKDEAMEWLEKLYGERSGFLIFLKVEPIFDPLRSDPRFEDLLRRVGLTS